MIELIKKTLLICFTLAAVACNPPEQGGELRLGTASLGGAYYPLGQSLATIVNQYAEGVSIVPVVTAGSPENPRLVQSRDIEAGLTNADLAYFANNGLPPYTQKSSLRSLGVLHASILHMITLEDSPINSFEDLRGKRIAVGPAGGGTMGFVEMLLEEHGMQLSDIKPSYLSYTDGFSQLSDGNVDASFALSGVPGAAISQLRASKKIKFIRIEETMFNKLLEKYTYYQQNNITPDIYQTTEAAVALGVNNLLIVREDFPVDTAYKITASIYNNLPELAASNATAKQIIPETYTTSSIPLHAGALTYFTEHFTRASD